MGEIHFEVNDGVALITLDNQAKRNAVDPAMRTGLEAAYQRVVADDGIRVAVITGAGEKAFSSGGDIDAYQELGTFGPGAKPLPPIPRPWPIWKPFIAAIRGYAVGGGFALALACDLRVVGKSAVIGASGLRRGAVQGAQQSQRLSRLVGMSKALEILLLSKYLSAAEAEKIGLANSVVADDDVLATALEWAKTMAGYSPWALQKTKQLVYEGFNMTLADAFEWEKEVTLEGYSRDDAQSGFAEFSNKK
ncbi:MAG: enoyl-CoA hydratase/isomerase family protein [Gammaproteobacteria bacterium]|nr:enoyl-CoA hydratase/isomerase family protein [Gammaproteobacteria bacterium]